MTVTTADENQIRPSTPGGVEEPRSNTAMALRGAPSADPVSFGVAALLLFVLAYGFPTEWFIPDLGDFESSATPPQGFVPAILVVGAAFAFVSTLHIAETYFRLISLEPLLPLFAVLAVASALWSEFPLQTLRLALPLLVVVYLGYWMVSIFRLDQLLAILVCVLAFGTLMQFAFIFGLPEFGQSRNGFSGTATDKNILGRLMAFSAIHFVLAAGVFPRHRLALWVFALLAGGLVVGSESATSLAGLMFVLGMLAVCRLFRARKTLYGAIGVGLIGGGGAAVFVATANLGFLAGLLGKDVTLTGRTVLWELSIREALNRPVLGHGWGGFWQGWLSPSRPILDENSWFPPHSHNALLEYFLNLGIVGAFIALGLFLRLFVRSARAVRTRPGTLGLWPIAFSSFAFIFSITEFGVVNRNVFLLFLTVHASVAALDRKDRSPVSAEPASTRNQIEVALS